MSASINTRTLKPETLHPETRLIHAGTLRSQFGETSEALFLTQGFVYDSAEQCEARFVGKEPGYLYSRFSNPTVSMFETRMAAFEGAEASRATASGMAAVHNAVVGQVKAGDHVVAAKALFGSCRWVVEDFLPRFGVASTLVNGLDLDEWRRAVRPNTKVFFLESPTNPTLEVLDIAAIAKIAHDAGAKLVVDNVFATPIFQSPLALGADCVVYSATKHIDGQGRCLGGIILASEKFIQDHIHNLLRQIGSGDVAVQCLGAAQGPGDAGAAGRAADRERGEDRRPLCEPPQDHAADLSRSRRPPAGRDHQEADARRLEPHRPRDQGRQAGGVPLPQCAASSSASPTISATPRAWSPIRRPRRTSGSRRRRAPSSASPTGWCGFRSGSSIPTTSPPT